jgi:hypothetical protein
MVMQALIGVTWAGAVEAHKTVINMHTARVNNFAGFISGTRPF